jgi:DNA-directed RNA polymerase specialized sigma24 family protein
VISKNQEQKTEFEGRFSRCRNSLYFLAWGALGSVGEAEQAMENCYRRACGQPKRFASDGEFGSWVIRLLIDEIVLVANRRLPEASTLSEAECPGQDQLLPRHELRAPTEARSSTFRRWICCPRAS